MATGAHQMMGSWWWWKKFLVFWLFHILKTMHLQQLKGMQSSRPGLFCKRLHENGMELDLGAEPPLVELFWVLPPGGKLTNLWKHWNEGLVWGLHSPTYRWFQFIRRPSFHHVANVDHYCSFHWWGTNKFSINVAYLKQIKKQWTC